MNYFLQQYFNAKETVEPRFTCALFKAVIKGCLNGKFENYSTCLTKRINI